MDYEFTCKSAVVEDIEIAEDVRRGLWEHVRRLTESFEGRRPTHDEQIADQVTEHFGGPKMAQSSWARDCCEAIVAHFGASEFPAANARHFLGLGRLFVEGGASWLITITEFLLQGCGAGRDHEFNDLLAKAAVALRFEDGRAHLSSG